VTPTADPAFEEAVYRKVTWRLLPFLMLCYVVAYLDRVNVGFAKLQMLADLRFSETVYGLGAGMFFIGYFFFEVPSNVILYRVGARIWIGRIMISWGLISAAFVFVKTPAMFYAMRFLLGAAEAGFYPGIILYLTCWYPSARRARAISVFMTAIPISGIIGGPLSGWIMDAMAGVLGWTGWQWMFLIEAAPALILGIATMVYLDNDIRSAKWLAEDEKRVLEFHLQHDRSGVAEHASLWALFGDRRIWHLCAIYFTVALGQYGLTFWLPTLIRVAGVQGVLQVGLLTAIPYAGGAVAMLALGRSADARRERRWHAATPLLLGAAGLALSAAFGGQATSAVICLTIAAAGVLSAAPLFWGLPTAFLGGVSAAAGIATINSVGNLAGFVSPYFVGFVKDTTGNTELGMYAIAVCLVGGAALVLRMPAKLVNR
jgi:MFS family permease